jgi:flagellar biosynthesis repressor protein FlbT
MPKQMHWLDRIFDILEADTIDLRALALLANGDPSDFYCGANLTAVDIRGQDLRGMSFNGANLTGVEFDGDTKLDPAAWTAVEESNKGRVSKDKTERSTMQPFGLKLNAGERIFINGAVLRVDREVSIEFLNEVTFLQEAHVMQPEQTTTPFRQLYFIIQSMLIDPGNAGTTNHLFDDSWHRLSDAIYSQDLHAALTKVRKMVKEKRYHEALMLLRSSFVIEDEILASANVREVQES